MGLCCEQLRTPKPRVRLGGLPAPLWLTAALVSPERRGPEGEDGPGELPALCAAAEGEGQSRTGVGGALDRDWGVLRGQRRGGKLGERNGKAA